MIKECEIIIWDVQHGNAAYIKSPNRKHIIVDVGLGSFENNNENFSPIFHLYKNHSVKQIDYAILTHPHKDHIEDIFNLDKLSPKVMCLPKHLTRDDLISNETSKDDIIIFEKFIKMNARFCGKFIKNDTTNPDNPDNFGGLEIKTFSAKNCSTSNLNNQSIVCVFSYAKSKIVIPGDNESCSYQELMKSENFKNAIKNADVLLAPHHGRESGYNKEFLEMVSPSLTIISDSSKKDTSALYDYGKNSKGWKVHSRSGKPSEKRNTLSTYNDGHISIYSGYNSNGKDVYLSVKKK